MSVEKLTYQIPKETRIGNISLNVKNLEQEADFYTELGFKIIQRTQNQIYLSANGQEPQLLKLSQSIQNKKLTTGLYHFAILLPSKQSFADMYNHILHSDKITLQGASDHGVSKALYLNDPEGNGIEVYYDQQDWKISDTKMDVLDTEELLSIKSNKRWSGLPENTKIGHIHLQVSDLESSNQFYGPILGMNHTFSFSGASFFAIGDYHHHVGLNTWRKLKEENENNLGLDHYTLVLPNKSEFEKLIYHLQRNKIPITKTGESIFLQDPDKLKIQIQYETK